MKPSKRITQADATLRQVNEPERLEALHTYQILDTDPEQVFNDLTQLAAFICGTPMSLVSLLDGERQWFKAKVGLAARETPREHAFCQYAMRADDVYEVPDAAADSRFAENPLVTGEPNIRFYAGAPLLSPEGQPWARCAPSTPCRASSAKTSAKPCASWPGR
ncbi:GAF domain-containing protein [Hymenobacter humi]|uniref:GAF domain-containing protein n=1 Tax=Hymenobacter humi TaxID=1411620 RepID=A0ABW2U330_9BACT